MQAFQQEMTHFFYQLRRPQEFPVSECLDLGDVTDSCTEYTSSVMFFTAH